MQCPKCSGSCIQVTSQNKKKTQEHRGLIVAIITAPFRMVRWFYRYLFIGKDEEYNKTRHWHCKMCANQFPVEVTPPQPEPERPTSHVGKRGEVTEVEVIENDEQN